MKVNIKNESIPSYSIIISELNEEEFILLKKVFDRDITLPNWLQNEGYIEYEERMKLSKLMIKINESY